MAQEHIVQVIDNWQFTSPVLADLALNPLLREMSDRKVKTLANIYQGTSEMAYKHGISGYLH